MAKSEKLVAAAWWQARVR